MLQGQGKAGLFARNETEDEEVEAANGMQSSEDFDDLDDVDDLDADALINAALENAASAEQSADEPPLFNSRQARLPSFRVFRSARSCRTSGL